MKNEKESTESEQRHKTNPDWVAAGKSGVTFWFFHKDWNREIKNGPPPIMSADNWTNCPKCFVDSGEAAQKKLKALYGKIPMEEWTKKSAEVAAEVTPDPHTLREDWEIGIHDKKLFISYRCRCGKCGFSHQFKHESTSLA